MSATTDRPIIDLDLWTERERERTERAAVIESRDREHGGMRSIDDAIAEQALAAERRKWLGYRPEIKKSELAALRHGEPAIDSRRVDPRRLREDCRAAVARWSKLSASDDRELLTDDVLYLVFAWPMHGSEPTEENPKAVVTDLGGKHAHALARIRADRIKRERRAAGDPRAAALATLSYIDELERLRDHGSLPLRRDWMDTARRDRNGSPMLTRGALRALRAAVKQAGDTRYWRAERSNREMLSGAIDLDELVDDRASEQGETENLPPSDAPDVIAEVLELPLDAGRAIIAQHEIRAHKSGDLRRQWDLSETVYKQVVSRGGTIVRERYSPEALLDALRDAPRRYRAMCERSAILALIDYRDGYGERERAETAVIEYRNVNRELPERRRIHLAAARSAMMRISLRAALGSDAYSRMRARSQYGAEIAERIAMSAERIIGAEIRREYHGMRASSEVAATYPGAIVSKDGMCIAPRIVWRKLPEPERARRAADTAELEKLLEKGEPLPRVAELRCALQPSWIHTEPGRWSGTDARRARAELPAWEGLRTVPPSDRAAVDDLYRLRDAPRRIGERRSAEQEARRISLRVYALAPGNYPVGGYREPPPRLIDPWAFIRRSHPRNLRGALNRES